MGFLSKINKAINPVKLAKRAFDPGNVLGLMQGSGGHKGRALSPEEQLAALLRDPNYRGFYPEPTPLPGTPPPSGNPATLPQIQHRPPPQQLPVIPNNYQWKQLAPTQAYQPTGAVQPLQVPPLGGMMNGR